MLKDFLHQDVELDYNIFYFCTAQTNKLLYILKSLCMCNNLEIKHASDTAYDL